MAAMDLGVARYLDETYRPKPLEIICYHCQQAAEKAIKALIIYYGVSVRYPNELFLEERHVKEALEFSDEILRWVQSIMSDDAIDDEKLDH